MNTTQELITAFENAVIALVFHSLPAAARSAIGCRMAAIGGYQSIVWRSHGFRANAGVRCALQHIDTSCSLVFRVRDIKGPQGQTVEICELRAIKGDGRLFGVFSPEELARFRRSHEAAVRAAEMGGDFAAVFENLVSVSDPLEVPLAQATPEQRLARRAFLQQ